MLRTLYPVSFQRYSSLAIFGAIVDGFSTWLVEQRYNRAYLRHRICLLPYIEAGLIRRGIRNVKEIGQADWDACRKSLLQRFPDQTGTTRALERYLHVHNLLTPPDQPMIGDADKYLIAYDIFWKLCAGLRLLPYVWLANCCLLRCNNVTFALNRTNSPGTRSWCVQLVCSVPQSF